MVLCWLSIQLLLLKSREIVNHVNTQNFSASVTKNLLRAFRYDITLGMIYDLQF